MIYIASFSFLFLISLSKSRNKELFFVGLLVILYQTCFRASSIGIDTSEGYLRYFTYIQMGINVTWVEPAWVFLNKIVIALGMGYEGVLIFAGLITIIPVAYVVYHTCENRCLGLAIYYGMYMALFSFNMMRQCVAISMALLAYYWYSEKKAVKAVTALILGFLFHKSVLIVISVVVFERLSLTYKRMVIGLAGSLAVGLMLNASVISIIGGKYAHYLLVNDGYSGFRESAIIPLAFSFTLSIFFIIIFSTHFDAIKDDFWFKITILGLAVMNATVRLGQGTRLVLYFSQAQIVFIPFFLNSIKLRDNRNLVATSYMLYLFANFMRILIAQWDTVNPFLTFWQM